MKKKVLMLLALFMAAMTASAMQIFVQTPTGNPITLDVEPSDSFENIKAKIQDKKGYRPELQRLVYGDKVCNDDQTLHDLSVSNESTLFLYVLGQNCYSLSIDNTMVNGTLTFSVNDNKDVDFADEDDVITISVSPEEGYAAGTVSAKAYTTWSARRRVAPNIALLGDIEVTPVEGVDTAWTFTMPAASVKASATFKKLSTLAFNPADMTGYMQVNIAGQTATPDQEGKIANVLEGDSVKLTANYGYKFRKVKAKRGISRIIDLSTLTADCVAQDGDVLTGTLGDNVKISIATGATVTLDNAVIEGYNSDDYMWAGITCVGDATIILKDGTENSVKGFFQQYPGIFVPEGKTLTIQGTGSLSASSNGKAAGIGAGNSIICGNITIEGGIITAQGGDKAAGIGGGNIQRCGNITITGGTVTATGGTYATGIGSGYGGSCGAITITDGVTKVKATKGANSHHSIGKGQQGGCGTVTIGGTVYWQNGAAQNDGATYLGGAETIYPKPRNIDLATLTGNIELQDEDIVTGTLGDNYIITIADGAEVTLNGVFISGIDEYGEAYNHAGITCLGDATINLGSGTKNTVKGFYGSYAGIQAGPTGKKLIIKGTGSLAASSNGSASGIGASKQLACGDIEIQGGKIFADGGASSAGIGGSYKANCGNITISGGNIDAIGPSDNNYDGPAIGSGSFAVCGDINISGGTIKAQSMGRAAGIGSSYGNNANGHSVCGNITITGGNVEAAGDQGAGIGTANVSIAGCSECGNITIANTVDCVTATKSAEADHSIGKGKNGSCGTVTIGGTMYWDGQSYQNGGDTYLTGESLTYPELLN